MATPPLSQSSSRGWLEPQKASINICSPILLSYHTSNPSIQVIASEIFPVAAVKALLYPGAVANGIIKNVTIPSWDDPRHIYNLTSVKEAPAVRDLQRIEIAPIDMHDRRHLPTTTS